MLKVLKLLSLVKSVCFKPEWPLKFDFPYSENTQREYPLVSFASIEFTIESQHLFICGYFYKETEYDHQLKEFIEISYKDYSSTFLIGFNENNEQVFYEEFENEKCKAILT